MSNKNATKPQAQEPQAPAVVEANLPAYMKKGARGAENVGQEDLVIPRLEIVQSLSPCRKRGDPAFIEGAEEGMMYNSVTRELYGREVTLVPVAYKKDFLLWKDRKKGGGLRGVFPTAELAEDARQQLEDRDDVEAIDTAQHFCYLVKPNGQIEEIVVSMSKTKMKVSRKWNTLIRIAEVDSFAKMYKMSGVMQTNANNEDFYNFEIAPLPGFVDEQLYNRAEKLWEMIQKGAVKASTEFDKPAESGTTEF